MCTVFVCLCVGVSVLLCWSSLPPPSEQVVVVVVVPLQERVERVELRLQVDALRAARPALTPRAAQAGREGAECLRGRRETPCP